MLKQHRDPEVNKSLIRLLDALCEWERNTSRRSILILKEDDYLCRADSGKCVIPDDIPDSQVLGHDQPDDIVTLKKQVNHLLGELFARKGKGLNTSERLSISAIQSTMRRIEG